MKFTDTIRGVFARNPDEDRIRAYLDQSVSMADLERRQAQCRRRTPAPPAATPF